MPFALIFFHTSKLHSKVSHDEVEAKSILNGIFFVLSIFIFAHLPRNTLEGDFFRRQRAFFNLKEGKEFS
jgi:Na+/H+ antiporter NhaA